MTLIVFSVLRDGVGWDYYSYFEIVELKMNGITVNDYNRFSWPWRLLADFSVLISYPKLFIIIPAFVTHLLVYFSLKKVFKNNDQYIKFALITYAFLPFFYLASFSTIRQWLAISITLYSFTFLNNNKWKEYIFILFIATTIHISAIFGVLAILIKKQRWSARSLIILAILSFGISFYIIDIIKMLDVPKLNVYLTQIDNSGQKILSIILLFSLYTIIIRDKIIASAPDFRLYIDLFILGIILTISIMPLGGVSSRISYYFLICLIIIIPTSISIFVKTNRVFILPIFVLLLTSILFIYLYIIQDVTSYGAGYLPYQLSIR